MPLLLWTGSGGVRRIGATFMVVVISACAEVSTQPDPNVLQVQTGDLSPFLSAAAATKIGPDGHFPDDPAPGRVHGRGTISPQRAKDLAVAFVNSYGPSLLPSWERMRRGSIELGSLTVEPRVFYAATPYGPLPANAHISAIKTFGPVYLVGFQIGGRRVLSVAVSAFNTDIDIVDGKLRGPNEGGSDFFAAGVPADSDLYFPIAPEAAVATAGRSLGTRVSAAPRLILAGRPYAPQYATWQLDLEVPIPVALKHGTPRNAERQIGVALSSPSNVGRAFGLSMVVPKRPSPTSEVHPVLVSVDPKEGMVRPKVEIGLEPWAMVNPDTVLLPESGK